MIFLAASFSADRYQNRNSERPGLFAMVVARAVRNLERSCSNAIYAV